MKKILVALDGSPRAPHVLASAAHFANTLGAKLHLYRAVSIPREIPIDLYIGEGGSLEEILIAKAEKELRILADQVPLEFLEGHHVAVASPWDGICRAAKEQAVDLIVIGSHGYAGLDKLLGTTAAKVVNHAECSVLVVRGDLGA